MSRQPENINWPAVLKATTLSGLTNDEIAYLAKISFSTLNNYYHGVEPRYRTGARIINIAREAGVTVDGDDK